MPMQQSQPQTSVSAQQSQSQNSTSVQQNQLPQIKTVYINFVDGITLEKVGLSTYPFKAQRPVYSVLDISRFEGLTGARMRPWQDALKEFLQCQKI